MTVQSTTRRIDYVGTGTVTSYAVPFYFLEDTHLLVYKRTAGVDTLLALTTDYTVTGAGVEAGGSVTPLVAVTANERIYIIRNPDLLQLTDYVQGGALPAEELEKTLDKLTMVAQRVDEKIDSKLGFTEANINLGVSLDMPTAEANRLLAWNSNGTALINVTNPGEPGALANFAASISNVYPNNYVQACALTAVPTTGNADIVLSPVGLGALLMSVPDGTHLGGDKRGTNAVDLQVARSSKYSVANGQYSVISGGGDNQAFGIYSSVPGGSGAIARHDGEKAWAAGYFTALGDCQVSEFIFKIASTTKNEHVLSLPFGDSLTLPEDGIAYSFECHLMGKQADGKTGDQKFMVKASRNSGEVAIQGTLRNILAWEGTTGFSNAPTVAAIAGASHVYFSLTPAYETATRWMLRVVSNKLKF